MKNTRIALLSLCALLNMAAHGMGIKNNLAYFLPKVALAASAYTVLSPFPKAYLEYKKANSYDKARPLTSSPLVQVNPQKSIKASEILSKHGALTDNETQQVIIYNGSWDEYFDVVITRPEESHSEGDDICSLLNQRYQIINKHYQKGLHISLALNTLGWSAGALLVRKSFMRPASTITATLGKSIIAYCAPEISRGVAILLGLIPIARISTRNADQFVVEHVKNPDHLEEHAAAYRQRHEQSKNASADIMQLIKPSDLSRAEYFEKAAEELRAKQQRKSS